MSDDVKKFHKAMKAANGHLHELASSQKAANGHLKELECSQKAAHAHLQELESSQKMTLREVQALKVSTQQAHGATVELRDTFASVDLHLSKVLADHGRVEKLEREQAALKKRVPALEKKAG